MHQVGRAAFLAAALAAAIAGSGLHAQQRGTPDRVGVLNAVIDYRVNWLRDSTAFDACRVYRVAGSPEVVRGGLLPAFRERLSPAASCGSAERADPRREMRVLVDSIDVAATAGRAYVTVRRGEQTHQEEYRLVKERRGDTWAVERVILSGAIRTYYRPAGEQQP